MLDNTNKEQNNDKYSDEYNKAFSHFENVNEYFENDVKIMNEVEVFIG